MGTGLSAGMADLRMRCCHPVEGEEDGFCTNDALGSVSHYCATHFVESRREAGQWPKFDQFDENKQTPLLGSDYERAYREEQRMHEAAAAKEQKARRKARITRFKVYFGRVWPLWVFFALFFAVGAAINFLYSADPTWGPVPRIP